MARWPRIGNGAPTNGQVDKASACPDAYGHEQRRSLIELRPDNGLVVACALACGGAMARLVTL